MELKSNNPYENRREIKGMLVIELAELDGLDRAEQSFLKRIISERKDRTRLLHKDDFDDVKRSAIFIGTYNPEKGDPGYLLDRTGHSRWAPVLSTARSLIDLELFGRVRPQLLAQALHMHRQKRKPWFQGDDLTLQTKMTSFRERVTRQYEWFMSFLETNKNYREMMENTGLTLNMVIEFARASFHIPEAHTNQSYAARMIRAIERAGFITKRKKKGYLGRTTSERFIFIPESLHDDEFDLPDEGWENDV
jgi:predicted P-loop ATPase